MHGAGKYVHTITRLSNLTNITAEVGITAVLVTGQGDEEELHDCQENHQQAA